MKKIYMLVLAAYFISFLIMWYFFTILTYEFFPIYKFEASQLILWDGIALVFYQLKAEICRDMKKKEEERMRGDI
jgi:hypothetical protein